MSIVMPGLAVSFAAFCVWLAVRIFNRRERWAKWTLAVLVILPVLYVGSFGPAVWTAGRDYTAIPSVERAYCPILWIIAHGPAPIQRGLSWWGEFGFPPGGWVIFYYNAPPESAVCFGSPPA
jgi:hypothetical protein